MFSRGWDKKSFRKRLREDSFVYFSGQPDEIRYQAREYHGKTDPWSGGGYKVLGEEIIKIKRKERTSPCE